MIQRIQSIFLLLASVSFFFLFNTSFASSNKSAEGIFADQQFNIFDNPVLLILTILGGGLALVNIFLYKQRPLQLRMGYVLIVLAILLPLVAFLLMLNEKSNTIVEDEAGIFLPIIAIIMTVLANRFIKKDDKLVKSMDRLR